MRKWIITSLRGQWREVNIWWAHTFWHFWRNTPTSHETIEANIRFLTIEWEHLFTQRTKECLQCLKTCTISNGWVLIRNSDRRRCTFVPHKHLWKICSNGEVSIAYLHLISLQIVSSFVGVKNIKHFPRLPSSIASSKLLPPPDSLLCLRELLFLWLALACATREIFIYSTNCVICCLQQFSKRYTQKKSNLWSSKTKDDK